MMTVRQVSVFIAVKTPGDSNRRTEIRKIISSLIAEGNARAEQEYWIWVPFPRHHDHPVNKCSSSSSSI